MCTLADNDLRFRTIALRKIVASEGLSYYNKRALAAIGCESKMVTWSGMECSIAAVSRPPALHLFQSGAKHYGQ